MGETKSNHDNLLKRATRDHSLRSATFTFTLTRLMVITILLVGGQMGRVVVGGIDNVRELFLTLDRIPVARILRQTVTTADINWYHGIAEKGYEKIPFNTDKPHNWAFFPLFPLLWRLGSKLTGELPITGVVLSHLFFWCGLIFVHKTFLAFGYDQALADRSIFYLAVFPTSYFYSLPLTESLFLMLTAASFYSAKTRRWWLAGTLGALASATRVTGIFILPALTILYWQTFGGDWRSKEAWREALLRKELLSLCLVPAGIVSFMFYLYAITGNPLAFKDILVTWGRGTGFFLFTLFDYVRDPLMIAVPWDFRIMNFAAASLALICAVILLKWKQWALGVYTLIAVIAALSSLVLQSQARYAMVLFPLFTVLAVAGKRPRVDETIRTVFVGLLCLMTALFAAHFTLALS